MGGGCNWRSGRRERRDDNPGYQHARLRVFPWCRGGGGGDSVGRAATTSTRPALSSVWCLGARVQVVYDRVERHAPSSKTHEMRLGAAHTQAHTRRAQAGAMQQRGVGVRSWYSITHQVLDARTLLRTHPAMGSTLDQTGDTQPSNRANLAHLPPLPRSGPCEPCTQHTRHLTPVGQDERILARLALLMSGCYVQRPAEGCRSWRAITDISALVCEPCCTRAASIIVSIAQHASDESPAPPVARSPSMAMPFRIMALPCQISMGDDSG